MSFKLNFNILQAKRYRNDENEFHKDFVRAFSKMIGRTSEVLSDPL